jgi:hypothetical protein
VADAAAEKDPEYSTFLLQIPHLPNFNFREGGMSLADVPERRTEESPVEDRLGAGIDFADPHSPLARYYLKSADVAGALILGLIIFYYGLLPLWHTDIWGHVQFGQWILDHQGFPDREPFTPYSDPAIKPLPTQWLAQTIYALSMRVGAAVSAEPEKALGVGAELLRTIHWLVLSARFIFLWLAYRRISRSSGWANFALAALFGEMISPSAVQRPQTFGVLCFSILLYFLSRERLSRFVRFGSLPVLFALWANLHGSFVVGLAFFFLNIVDRAIAQRGEAHGKSWLDVIRSPGISRPFLAFLLSLAATSVNPHGPMLLVDVLTFAAQPNLRELNEWRPLAFHEGPGSHLLFLAAWAAVLAFWALSGFAKTSRLMSVLPFGLWPLLQERAMVWWLILVPWALASFGPIIVQRFGLAAVVPPSVPSLRKTILAAGIAALTLLWAPPVQWLVQGKPWPRQMPVSLATPWQLGLELQSSPSVSGRWLPDFAAAVRSYPGSRFQGSIFCSESLGDYLIGPAPADAPVMVYTHVQYFPAEYFRHCMEAKYARGDWRQWFAANHVNLVAIEPDMYPDLARLLRDDPEWDVVADETNAGRRQLGDRLFIAVRRKPA